MLCTRLARYRQIKSRNDFMAVRVPRVLAELTGLFCLTNAQFLYPFPTNKHDTMSRDEPGVHLSLTHFSMVFFSYILLSRNIEAYVRLLTTAFVGF